MRSRWNNLPLKFRITGLYVGLLFVLLATLGSFLYFDTRNFMIHTTSLRLQGLAQNALGHLVLLGPPRDKPGSSNPFTLTVPIETPTLGVIAQNLARDLTWQDYTTLVLDPTGARLADGSEFNYQATIPPPDQVTLQRALDGEHVTYITRALSQDMLVILEPVRYPRPDSAIVGVVQMVTPLDMIDTVLERQRVLIVLGVIIALGLAAVGGLALTENALTPLKLMLDVCRRIAAGDLSQRVNLPHRRDETGQLASTFDDMVERLDDSFTAQRQFVADASHELRTPLTAISGSLEVLLLAPEGDPDTTRRVLHGMRREVQRLTRLVTDLLTLTRLDAQRKPNLRMIDLADLGREVVETLKPLAQNRTVTIETEGNTKCPGDADQLKQVFYNLLGNAIQATDPDKGAITLQIQGQENASRVCVAVTDNGGGIPQEAQPHIFERFYRVDKARARASGGSGLGLAIVKAIVERHGGIIEPVESKVGQGTTIRFKLNSM